ncbi:TetR/AcrR family transcriptional regulator [Actinomadura meridiana]|uniref:TetR/AcrR family transcriptional regulator n=1 Tax=Actinomadura meridiana TaxID=559626 RepID=UPI0031ECEA56
MDSDGFPSLPRGRHHLTRAQVSASQRDRLLQGITQAVAENGYARTSVADVLKRAHVSRETFYEHFADKQACFLAAYQATADRIATVVRDALKPTGEPVMRRLEHAVCDYLRELSADASSARMFLLEIYAAGPAAAVLRHTVHRGFIELVDAALMEDERFRRLPDHEFASTMLVGGVASLVTGAVAMGQHATLPKLCTPILSYLASLLDPG